LGRITIEVPWDFGEREAVDAIASLALKKEHRRYGEWMRRLAEIVRREVNPPKGHWQAYWTVATKVFEILYHGWSEESARNYVAPLAREMRITNYDKLVSAIARNMDYILGRHSRMESEGGGR